MTEPIELATFAPRISDHHQLEVEDRHQHTRHQKRERKLHRLLEKEEMKFSHSIQFNSVPDWSGHYISYSNLKKL